jgi:putative membrane-bound dehydrogenase-like protein
LIFLLLFSSEPIREIGDEKPGFEYNRFKTGKTLDSPTRDPAVFSPIRIDSTSGQFVYFRPHFGDLRNGAAVDIIVEKGSTIKRSTMFRFHFKKQARFIPLKVLTFWFCCLLAVLFISPGYAQSFSDKSADATALPQVPDGFEVTEFAREPLVRQPCSMAFDQRGRLFVGMGPQYRSPKPETPGDNVVLFLDTNGDGKADTTKVFATGFNAIQSLAWRGNDLWVANAPDLTIVRDLDGDDQADQYIRLYTDLGNLEHGLQGLTWAPDGKLYMSKGNSKGLSEPGRYAPRPFRELWGVTVPEDVPDFPAPEVFTRETYQRNYHDPEDDWGLHGGVLRCDDGGHNLEIVARGFRNPWSIAMDGGFNWLGTDNDQVGGDRVIMPFYGAHFGWNHPWSSHWDLQPHPPTAPVSGPLFEGSGTGIVFGDSPQFPQEYRGVFFINDWLRKTTFVWRPQWDGALLKPAGGDWTPFIIGGQSLFRPTDMGFGPDGSLWVLGWGSGYGAEWKEGELTNEGRIFRIRWKDASAAQPLNPDKPLEQFTVSELLAEFKGPLPVRQIAAQDELVRRGPLVQAELLSRLQSAELPEIIETWTAWTLGRIIFTTADNVSVTEADRFFQTAAAGEVPASLNLQIQSIRILARRLSSLAEPSPLAEDLAETTAKVYRISVRHTQPRMRMETVQAIHQARFERLLPDLLELAEGESDPVISYAIWQSLRTVISNADLRALLMDGRAGVRRAALLALLETHSLEQPQVESLAGNDPDPEVRAIAQLWIDKASRGVQQIVKGKPLQTGNATGDGSATTRVAVIGNIKSKGSGNYRCLPAGLVVGSPVYSDRPYRLREFSRELLGYDLLQTANNDDDSKGKKFLSFEAILPVRVLVGIDYRQPQPPKWLRKHFQPTELTAVTDEGVTFLFFEQTFPGGLVTLGGNTDDGQGGGKGNYIVAVTPVPLARLEPSTTTEQALELLAEASPERGRVLFHHAGGAGCAKCHSLTEARNGFGPNLAGIGGRSNARHIIQSIVEPSEVITEGFNQVNVLTDEGLIFSGVLLEESGLTLSLGLSTGERVDIPKSMIDDRSSSPTSAMPGSADTLTPQQVADVAAYLLALPAPTAAASDGAADSAGFSVQRKEDRLLISLAGEMVGEFVFDDDQIRRPYFSNIRLPNGLQLTRNHPPVEGVDSTDHPTMHPGVWLGFGDISGHDFWRNQGSIKHQRFINEPEIQNGRLIFQTESELLTQQGQPLCRMSNHFTLTPRPGGWLLVWSATFHADRQEIVFGDQEEMGLGARLATPLTEQNGGIILNSSGLQTAQQTWGQLAHWCDYSGPAAGSGGILLMAGPQNFRQCGWHNRDYGLFVANPFGREAMKQGPPSAIRLAVGEELTLTFGGFFHDNQPYDPEVEFRVFEQVTQTGQNYP